MTDSEPEERRERGFRTVADVNALIKQNRDQLRCVVARWVYNPADIDDVVQITCDTAVRRIHTLDLSRCLPLTWLCSIARYKCWHANRKRMRDEARLEPLDEDTCPDPKPGPCEQHEQQCTYAELYEHLYELPVLWREVLALHHGKRVSYKEIGRMYNMTERHVRYIDEQAMAAMRLAYGVKRKAAGATV